jgi:F-type H+-transporting ATPase subunit b
MRIGRGIAAVLLALGLALFTTPFTGAEQEHAPKEEKAKKEDPHKKDGHGKKDDHGTATAGKDGHGDAHAGEHKSHTIFEWALEQSIWTLAVFILLLIVLRTYAWGPILQGLRQREENIRLAVEEAKIARQETERVREEFKAEMARAYAEIPKIMEEARKDAAALREEMKSRAASEIQADRDRLRREIETARDQALAEIWNQSAQLATLISARAIGRVLTEEDQRRLNEEALATIQDASKNWKGDQRHFGEG